MKSPMPAQPRSNWLHELIQEATHARAKDLSQIENIIRDEIFHSTLDWQSRERLADAAKLAFGRLNIDRTLYGLDHDCRMAMFEKMRAESAMGKRDTPSNRTALANAEKRYQTLRNRLLVLLDGSAPK